MTDIALADIPQARDLVPTDRKLLPAPLDQLREVGQMIQCAGAFVSKEVRADEGACVAIAYMAALHGTDPIMTASKAFLVNGRLAWEAQYISALVRRHIDEPFDITFHGTGAQRFARVVGKMRGKALDYQSPQLGQIKTKQSPLWVTDPDQQLGAYYSVRAWARRHAPDVLLGIYAVEELQSVTIRDITPPPPDAFREDDDSVDAPVEDAVFEPSGGFVTDGDTVASENVAMTDTPDDILAWAAAAKTEARQCPTPEGLQALWDSCEANRRKLWRTEKLGHDALEAVFKDRLADLS